MASAPSSLAVANAVNTQCPFSGKPIRADALTVYRGKVVGFCNPGCRDKFAADPSGFPEAIETIFGATAR